MTIFSKMLRQLREQRNLTQKDIAKYLGITRQAVASYESGKREPDYNVLKNIADYFDVSVDYLLGRGSYDCDNALIIGMNIKLIRGNLSFKQLSEDIRKKVGIMILPDMLELYEKGKRTPFVSTIKALAEYASVPYNFFYRYNTAEAYRRERQLHEFNRELLQNNSLKSLKDLYLILQFMDSELFHWVAEERNLRYIKLAKEICDAGLSVEAFKPLINSIKKTRVENKSQ